MSELAAKMLELSHLRSTKISILLECSDRYVRKVLKRHGLAHRRGPPDGEDNPSWKGGRMVDLDGYILLSTKPHRRSEHRQVMAESLGRELTDLEVGDLIDAITIHNDISNLRLFATNGEHLAATPTGVNHDWSVSGLENIGARTDRGREIQPVDTYRLRKERGDVRLRAILRAAIELGKEHPCLLGTMHWLEQIGIDPTCDHSLKLAWGDLMNRFDADIQR